MKTATDCLLVLVTAPNLKVARDLAQTALRRRLVACASLVPGLESHYWWEGQIESAREVLLLMKTTNRRFAALDRLVIEKHPYATPEVVCVSLDGGAAPYLKWLKESVRPIAQSGR